MSPNIDNCATSCALSTMKTRAVLGFRGLYLECLVYGGMFVTCSVCVWLLLVMLRVCWLSVFVVGWFSNGCRLWLFGLDPTGTLMSVVLPCRKLSK